LAVWVVGGPAVHKAVGFVGKAAAELDAVCVLHVVKSGISPCLRRRLSLF
jgi:hypothetical protein